MIEKILAERGGRYSAFPDHAVISQAIKTAMSEHISRDGW